MSTLSSLGWLPKGLNEASQSHKEDYDGTQTLSGYSQVYIL